MSNEGALTSADFDQMEQSCKCLDSIRREAG